eukprot:351378-Chlamydomonas_euryale.AAC.2
MKGSPGPGCRALAPTSSCGVAARASRQHLLGAPPEPQKPGAAATTATGRPVPWRCTAGPRPPAER